MPLDPLPIPQGEVHLWRWSLQGEPELLADLWEVLNDDERKRADRFQFDHLRRRFVVARATLKRAIARYLDRDPVSVQFTLGDRGKPSLTPATNPIGLQFNLSHSHEMALAGFICDRRIGVDLEHLRPVSDAVALARRFFCASEYEAIAALTAEGQSREFLQRWTDKEAFLKGIGSGIGGGLDSIEIHLQPDNSLDFSFPDPQTQPPHPWQILPLAVGSDYLATIAIEGQSCRLHRWHLENVRY